MPEEKKGWDFHKDEPNPHTILDIDEPEEKIKYSHNLFFQVFTTPQGQEILDILERVTIERPTTSYGGIDGQAQLLGMSIREGENNIFRYIKNQIKNGAKLDVKKEQE